MRYPYLAYGPGHAKIQGLSTLYYGHMLTMKRWVIALLVVALAIAFITFIFYHAMPASLRPDSSTTETQPEESPQPPVVEVGQEEIELTEVTSSWNETTYYIFGKAHNQSGVRAALEIRLKATYLDEEGFPLLSFSDDQALEYLLPNQELPFALAVDKPPTGEIKSFDLKIKAYRWRSFDQRQIPDFTILWQELDFQEGKNILFGEVRNDSQSSFTNLMTLAAFYTKNHKLLTVDFDFIPQIGSGETAFFVVRTVSYQPSLPQAAYAELFLVPRFQEMEEK